MSQIRRNKITSWYSTILSIFTKYTNIITQTYCTVFLSTIIDKRGSVTSNTVKESIYIYTFILFILNIHYLKWKCKDKLKCLFRNI